MRRRSLLQKRGASAAGVGLLTGSAAAETNVAESGEYYEILGDGTLRYSGPESGEQNHLKEATSAFNARKRRGDWSFRTADGYVQVVPEAVRSPTMQPARNCKGKSKYESEMTNQGYRRIYWFDDCQCLEIQNKLMAGAGLAGMTSAISLYCGAAPVAAASACAAIILRTGAKRFIENNRGMGVKFWSHSPNLRDVGMFQVMPQQ